MRLTFHGAAAEVTGSCFEVDTGEVRFLVDCGIFQGSGADAKNARFAFQPRDIAFVLLTHAHIDHSGLVPRLVAQGFRGAVYATAATCRAALHAAAGAEVTPHPSVRCRFRDAGHILGSSIIEVQLGVFVGFQAAGTLGRRIVDGAASVRLFGDEYPVKARVFTIGGLSAHALRDAIQEKLGWQAAVPAAGQAVAL